MNQLDGITEPPDQIAAATRVLVLSGYLFFFPTEPFVTRTRRRRPTPHHGMNAYILPGSRWSSLPMDARNPREVTGALSASWMGLGYLREGGVD
ncbi:hypothetical protein EVAR_83065_1 [Eumeta japonica]|uniref:Uncharacterized protein n=1 Tax=Eumeta variegata TaxID=151549 RepID=A0A4C1VLF7_EUMVA|nr:hypothetical protein EVAR_83065_1 [Eumeta japonica]